MEDLWLPHVFLNSGSFQPPPMNIVIPMLDLYSLQCKYVYPLALQIYTYTYFYQPLFLEVVFQGSALVAPTLPW